MKTILVPTDFSACAFNATNFACELAIQYNTDIILLNVYELKFSDAGIFIDFDDSAKEFSESKLKELQIIIETNFPSLKGKTSIVSTVSPLFSAIEELAKKKTIDLIVMGSKGRTGWEEVLLGSETAKMISYANQPLMVVPSACKFEGFQDVLFSVELDERFSQKDIQLMKTILDNTNNLHLFHNYKTALDVEVQSEKDLYNLFLDLFPEVKMDFGFDFKNDNLKSIKTYIELINPQLIIAKAHHRTILKSLFHKSITENLTRELKEPLLILKEVKNDH